jgi:hypothetical protein
LVGDDTATAGQKKGNIGLGGRTLLSERVAVRWRLSPEASYITGVIVPISGGC